MSIEQITQNWALVLASVLGLAIVLFLVIRVLQDSTRGQLAAELTRLGERQKAQLKARKALARAERQLSKLGARAESAKPSKVQDARDALQEAQKVLRLVDDQVLIASNRVRTIILEEYPPKRQAAMRRRYLGDE